MRRRATGFNPLHCGAVVASHARPGRDHGPGRGLNPLHCGAVVASLTVEGVEGYRLDHSIPFIAGQWSLLSKPKKTDETEK